MKYLYLIMPIVSAILSITTTSKNGYDLLGIWFLTGYITWNIYAYFNSKRMLPPMNYGIDYSARGDKSARTFLVALCMALYIFAVVVLLFGVKY